MVYGAGLYKTALYVGVPLIHLYHQLSTKTDEYMRENPIIAGTKGSIVAVTGCTDGIGKDLSLNFAKENYGLYMMARNQQKLDFVKD
jgi:hypothetical protein